MEPAGASTETDSALTEAKPVGGISEIQRRFWAHDDINKDKVSGIITVNVTTDHTGKVVRLAFIGRSRNEAWNKAMEDILNQTTFLPAERKGQAIASTVRLAIPLTETAMRDIGD